MKAAEGDEPGQSSGESGGSDDVEALRRRVRRLETTVDELEQLQTYYNEQPAADPKPAKPAKPAAKGKQPEPKKSSPAAMSVLPPRRLRDGEPNRKKVPDPEPFFSSLDEFVELHFLALFARHESKVRWCPKWWDHAEAVDRLSALWRSWETLRLDPGTGIATWYRDFLDSQLDVLFSDTGPFAACNTEDHRPVPALQHAAVPPGFWTPAQQAADETRSTT